MTVALWEGTELLEPPWVPTASSQGKLSELGPAQRTSRAHAGPRADVLVLEGSAVGGSCCVRLGLLPRSPRPAVWDKPNQTNGVREEPVPGATSHRARFDSRCHRSCGRLVTAHLPLPKQPAEPPAHARTQAWLPDGHVWNVSPGRPSTRRDMIDTLCQWHEEPTWVAMFVVSPVPVAAEDTVMGVVTPIPQGAKLRSRP